MPPNPPYLLPYADITWRGDDLPFAANYDDIYWSTSGGLAEKQHVFLQGCELQHRWPKLRRYDAFTIAELGFGFGLNFLLTLRDWMKEPNRQGRLEYISFEKHLVAIEHIKRIASQFGLEEEYRQFASAYPLPIPGPHRMRVTDNLHLTLIVGDASEQIKFLSGQLDAVYLDGFSPAKNEVLWQSRLIDKLGKSLRPGGLIATYSVAGQLRRNLSGIGLIVEKATGYGNKRHMLKARAQGEWQPNAFIKKQIAIIGAGLTGLFTADALEDRGHEVSLFDQTGRTHGAVANIQQIAIYPQLSLTPQPYSNLYLRAFQFFLNHRELNQCGRVELLDTNEKQDRAKRLTDQLSPLLKLLDEETCREKLGLEVTSPGLYNGSAGWLAPDSIGANRPIHPYKLLNFNRDQDQWLLDFDTGETTTEQMSFDTLILATGPADLPQLKPLGLMPLRGQSLRLGTSSGHPRCVFSGDKTWFPAAEDGGSTISGTYSRFDDDLEVREEDTKQLLRGISAHESNPEYSAHVGIRSASRDRLPIVGKLPDWRALDQHLTDKIRETSFQHYEPELFVSLGFGSHAGTLGPYCAELLSQLVSGDVISEPLAQLEATRFAKRDA